LSATRITIHLDGEPVTLPAPATIADLLQRRDLPEALLSLALNGAVVPRARYAETVLHDGDELVGVIQVGGG
jgi:sulfur carrier protein